MSGAMMKTTERTTLRWLRAVAPIALLASLAFASCTTIAPYSETAYQMALSVKLKTATVLSKATESYPTHAAEMDALMKEVDEAYEYNLHRTHNEVTTQQWALMRDPEHKLLGGFKKEWQAQDHLKEIFVQEWARLINKGLDTILDLEGGKIKPSDVPPQ